MRIWLLLVCILCAHSVNLPDLGDIDYTNMSNSSANQLGVQIIAQIRDHGKLIDDYDTTNYLANLSQRIINYSPYSGWWFNFYLVKDNQINAFALPSNHICVNNGLIYSVENEAELVAVIAHEMSHLLQKHVFRNLASYARAQKIATAGLIAGGILAAINPIAGLTAISGAQDIAIHSVLSFSRDFEREADRIGQLLMYRANFDPLYMPEFFQRMEEYNKFSISSAAIFLNDHPVTIERIAEAELSAKDLQVKMRPDSKNFLLIREKARVRQLGSSAIQFYINSIKDKRYIDLDSQYYGLSLAYFYNHEYKLALNTLNMLDSNNNPIVINLKVDILLASSKYKAADQLINSILVLYPNYAIFDFKQLNMYIKMHNLVAAKTKLNHILQQYPQDIYSWSAAAALFADANLNNPAEYHYALGMIFYIAANYERALEQFKIAKRFKPDDIKMNFMIDNTLHKKIY